MEQKSHRRFEDKKVLVTGSTRHTGLAIAESFAREGAAVAINGRKSSDVKKQADRLRKLGGAGVMESPGDISESGAVQRIFEQIDGEWGRLDVLVNNAVIQGAGYSFLETPFSLLEDVFRINVFGAFRCGQEAARIMLRQGHGAIVNISSNTAERAIRNRSAYIASKSAIDSLNRAMALELGPKGIRSNCVVAGYIHTARWEDISESLAARRRQNIPLGVEAAGKDIADAVMFLASDAASGINGARLVVDGGSLAQLYPEDCDC